MLTGISTTWLSGTALAVERIDRHMVAPNAVWPLTDDLEHLCPMRGYRAYCGRNCRCTTDIRSI